MNRLNTILNLSVHEPIINRFNTILNLAVHDPIKTGLIQS